MCYCHTRRAASETRRDNCENVSSACSVAHHVAHRFHLRFGPPQQRLDVFAVRTKSVKGARAEHASRPDGRTDDLGPAGT